MTGGQGPQPGFSGASQSVGAPLQDDWNPWTAAASGDLDRLQQSLQHLSLTATAADEGQGYTVFQAAASYSHIPIMEWLLTQVSSEQERHALVNAVDHDGDSALHYAGTVASSRFLVESARIDVNAKNEAGMTALHAKTWELEETMSEDDFDEDNGDYIDLKAIVEYLQSLSSNGVPRPA